MSDTDARPEPEALLAEAAKEGRGRLKIFLGAAPGVGKTYSMLEDARHRLAEGIDVVVGIVETHGRGETETLLGRARNRATSGASLIVVGCSPRWTSTPF